MKYVCPKCGNTYYNNSEHYSSYGKTTDIFFCICGTKLRLVSKEYKPPFGEPFNELFKSFKEKKC